MAEETPRPAAAEAAAPAEAKRGRGPLTLLIVAAASVMILSPVVTIVAIRLMSPAAEKHAVRSETTEVTLPKVQVNVAETNGTRYAQIEVVLELSDKLLAKSFQNQSEENPQGRLRRVMATVIRIISGKGLNGLLSPEAKQALAEEIRTALNEQLREENARGMVTDVYFCGFLIQ